MAATDNGARTSLASMLEDLLGHEPSDRDPSLRRKPARPARGRAPATIVVRSPDALRRIVTAPGELGFGRAYVAGDLDVEGDIFDALTLGDHLPGVKLSPKQWAAAAKLVGHRGPQAAAPSARGGAPARPPPLEGARRGGDRATTTTSSNDFYRMVLGPSMTYSCAVFDDAERHARGCAGAEVRADLPQARPAARACACSTSAAAGAAW